MARRIKEQNTNLKLAWNSLGSQQQDMDTNLDVCAALGLAPPNENYRQTYGANDIKVRIIK